MELLNNKGLSRTFILSALCRLNGIPTAMRAELFLRGENLDSLQRGVVPGAIDPCLRKALVSLDWEKCGEEDGRLSAKGYSIVAFGDKAYPQSLASTPDPPPALYAYGSVECLACPSVAIVGSRLCTVYGKNVAKMLAGDLAGCGICVISGLARGIDTSAHEGSLRTKGRAAAVLATGIDRVYPRENGNLARQIAERGGVVISESPPGTPPLPRYFPVRNRIIAGLSWGVIIVEASERSGSLVTARMAIELGRELFAVPHNVTSGTGIGPNTLIKRGATLVRCASDVLEQLPPYLREKLPASQAESETGETENLSGEARQLLATLKPDEGVSADELFISTGIPIPKLMSLLLELQMVGLCVELPGTRYARGVPRP